MMFMQIHLAAQAAADYPYQPYATDFFNPYSQRFAPPIPRPALRPALSPRPMPRPLPRQQARPPQTDEAGANFVDAALGYALPAYPLVKAGAAFLDSPTTSGGTKVAVVGLAAYFLFPDLRKEVDKVLKRLF